MDDPPHPEPEDFTLLEVLRALAEPTRLQIVQSLLRAGTELGCECFGQDLRRATVAHHFRVLREAGVTRTRVDGRCRWLSVREDELNRKFPGLLPALMPHE
jgi:DNA-binding transcriptional ArsR family regulator